jgi:hypothetical protein
MGMCAALGKPRRPPRTASRTRRHCRPGQLVRRFHLIYEPKDHESSGKRNGSRSTWRRTITTTGSLRRCAARWRWRASKLAELVDAAHRALSGRQRPRGCLGGRGLSDKSQGHGEAVRAALGPRSNSPGRLRGVTKPLRSYGGDFPSPPSRLTKRISSLPQKFEEKIEATQSTLGATRLPRVVPRKGTRQGSPRSAWQQSK